MSMNTNLPLQAVADDVCVAPQLTADAMAEAARLGFRSVVNNRPDFEEGPAQPTSAQIEAAATAAGLAYRHLPVSSSYQSPQDAAAMAGLLRELPRPILMFCRSGGRSAKLFRLALDT
jgi:uncharacterized protein (TIGR01244 family)